MSLLELVGEVAAVVALMHVASIAVVLGRSFLDPRTVGPALSRMSRRVSRPLAALVAVLAVNGVVRRVGVELSWVIGVNATTAIYAIEGTFVAWIQSFATPAATAYFSFVYVFGYVYLLTFPVVAYALCEDTRALRTLIVAYGINYGVGVVCYVLIVAYGPRNFMPDLVGSLLFESWPRSQLLTSQVNENTNVFPSLHTSLAATVAMLAVRTRRRYPRWTPIAVGLGASIAVSTMYLGIHWATDVVFGTVLAAGSVLAAERYETYRNRDGDDGGGTDGTDGHR
ncbi:phosphatase PAP2 family protein [Halobaculum sp. CBA1158]|uniref:phosphatase PAP2 family protein n=1 Tax=Halobaculum sp. CBA1158 TaxID=2904243 RepID=UPI001F26E858|nr:phosphatase PAP2 family protein [Halobaculum sp. CBA1158]UIP00253.1 phosphatase PAP2 family protein [Halobaculum sp. CBA1158]